jgi:2-iminobutanoate/2-iminopropanoate deaminase
VELITSSEAPESRGPFSPGLSADGWVFLSGQGGFDPATGELVADDIEAQTAQTLANVETLLRAAGASLGDVVSCLVHLSDLAEWERFNRVYESRFGDPKPVRTTVGAQLVAGMRVEITVVAKRP